MPPVATVRELGRSLSLSSRLTCGATRRYVGNDASSLPNHRLGAAGCSVTNSVNSIEGRKGRAATSPRGGGLTSRKASAPSTHAHRYRTAGSRTRHPPRCATPANAYVAIGIAGRAAQGPRRSSPELSQDSSLVTPTRGHQKIRLWVRAGGSFTQSGNSWHTLRNDRHFGCHRRLRRRGAHGCRR
jgi:hypothetical protein